MRKTKQDRLPQLKAALRRALAAAATSLEMVPPEEQMVLVVILPRYEWENYPDVPLQLTLQAQRKQLLDAQRSGASALDLAVRIRDN